MFSKDKEVVNISIDPNEETADVNPNDNHFPKLVSKSKFDEFVENAALKVKMMGAWKGILDIPGSALKIVFNISENEKGKLSGTPDSPDQGAKGIALGDVYYANELVHIEIPDIGGEYTGSFTGENTIEGKWKQGGSEFTLNLEKI